MFEAICMDSNGDTIYYLTQWDINQKLIMELTGNHFPNSNSVIAPVIHFCNSKSSVAVTVQSSIVNNQVVADIPNELLTMSLPIYAYVYLTDYKNTASKKTVATVCIPVVSRKKPDGYQYTQNITNVQYSTIVNDINISKNNITRLTTEIQNIDAMFDLATVGDVVRYLGI